MWILAFIAGVSLFVWMAIENINDYLSREVGINIIMERQ